MSQNFRLIATLDLKAGAWDKVSAALKECVIQTRKEEGNSFYTAHFEQNNQNRIVFIEDWANQEVLDIHMQTEHFKKLAKVLEPYLEGPMQVAKLTEIKI